MQDINSSNKATILAGMTEDAEYFLRDARDNKDYCVAKLKDGNLWMTQNLDLDIVTDGSITYDNTTTDIGWNFSTNSYDTASWSPSAETYEGDRMVWDNSDTTPESHDLGNLYWIGYTRDEVDYIEDETECEAIGGTWEDDSWCDIDMGNYTVSTGNSHYHLGNYYNWTAAVAMNDSSNYPFYNEQEGKYENTYANQSICPANWTLPKGGESDSTFQTQPGSFRYLIIQYGWNDYDYTITNPYIWKTPIKVNHSGSWYYGTLHDVGSYGDFWSSVVRDNNDAYVLTSTDDSDGLVSPNEGYGRGGVASVRCLAR